MWGIIMSENETGPTTQKVILGVSMRDWYLTLGLGIFVVFSYFPMLLPNRYMGWFTKEDHIYESLGAFFFFLAGMLFLKAFLGTRHNREPRLKRLSYLALTALFIAFAGEEISWGQRILGFKTPEKLEKVNHQEETTFHNLKWIAGEEEDQVLPLNIEQIFLLFVVTFGFLVPVAALVSKRAHQFFDRFMPVLPWFIGTLTILNYLVQKGFVRVYHRIPDWYASHSKSPAAPIYEIREYVFAALLLALVAYYVFVTLRTKTTTQQAATHESGEAAETSAT
jgi:hypothetical protein